MGEPQVLKPDRLLSIFRDQKTLMEKYHPIEEANGLLITPDVPIDLNCRFGQARLKDMAWRMTEELGEACHALSQGKQELVNEELVDALHFLVELTILADSHPVSLVYVPGEILPPGVDLLDCIFEKCKTPFVKLPDRTYESVSLACMKLIQNMAMTCNLLKNRPWKQTYRETDWFAFMERLVQIWDAYIGLCKQAGIDAPLLHILYVSKAKVNRMRQESGY